MITQWYKKLLLCLFFINAACLYAHIIELTIIDADLGIPLEGAAIRNWDGAEYACDSKGKVVLRIPTDRPVIVHAAYPGYENGRIAVNANSSSYTLELRLLGVMESRELVIEAVKPGTSESQTGRSVSVTSREIAQTGEIGIIEDVMTTIKLLPGVGYTGMFNALPSIRGGYPGDMSAALDGYYINNPYHWNGGFSIFDPKMIHSATLSHGVFSSRYGHTISGLLELTAKKPSRTETEFELSANTSAANFNLSVPLSGRGGILFMGRLTYYDPVVFAAKQLSKAIDALDIINSISSAPYIRSGTITANYRLSHSLELRASAFWGMDGAGAAYDTGLIGEDGYSSRTTIDLLWINYQGFLTAGLMWNPRNDMLVKLSLGTGYEDTVVNADMQNWIINRAFEKTDKNNYYYDLIYSSFESPYDFYTRSLMDQTNSLYNAQGRIDYDWEIGSGFIAAAGVQEMYSRYSTRGTQIVQGEKWLGELKPEEQQAILNKLNIDSGNPLYATLKNSLRVSFPVNYPPNAGNSLFTTSGYVLGEYATADNFFSAELGLRLDHYCLIGTGFTLQTKPALNPRLNIDLNILSDFGIIESLGISAGTGLFTSMNTNVFIAEKQYNIKELKPNRSWTSVLGINLKLPRAFHITVEGYYKYIYDRMYVPITLGTDDYEVNPRFNGEGKAWGIDILLQKTQSRFLDGWISYSFNWTKYRDPDADDYDMIMSGSVYGDGWHFPSFHRFHTLNLILNIKPTPRFNIYTRFGIASGVQLSKRITDKPYSYPVYVFNPDPSAENYFIEKFLWPSRPDEKNRTTPSLPLDVKFSILGANSSGKTRYEVYGAVENILALVYQAQGNTTYNQYTGKEEPGSMAASYEIPIPIPSFGVKFSY